MNISGSGSQIDYLDTLTEISRALMAKLDLRSLYDTIYEQVSRVMDATLFFIALHEPDKTTLNIPYMREDGELLENQQGDYANSMARLVIEDGRPIIFNSEEEYERFVRERGMAPVDIGDESKDVTLSLLFVPLNTGDRTTGVLSVQSRRAGAYGSEDVETLSIIAGQAAVAIENARLYNEQERRVVELQTIQSIVQQLAPLNDEEDIARLITVELKSLIEYHSCRLFVLDFNTQALHSVVTAPGDRQLHLKMGEGMVGWIALHGEPQIVVNTLNDPRMIHISGTPTRPESMIAAPLSYQGRVRGVITLTKLGVDQFDANDLRILEIIAAQTGLALDRAMLYAQLRLQAITDELTGLFNRRYLIERFAEEQSRAVRSRRPLTAVMLDIDKFKSVNDRFGHAAGDTVLRTLAQVVREEVRAEDIVARYGGEEFCILLPEIDREGALHAAERLRTLIAGLTLPADAGVDHVTASVGVAFLRPNDTDVTLFHRADAAMYLVKAQGGNNVRSELDLDEQ